MTYHVVVWVARLFFIATISCFALGILGDRPALSKAAALLAPVFLILAIRARQLRPHRL